MCVNVQRCVCPYSQKFRIIILRLRVHICPNFDKAEHQRQREGWAGATGDKENGPGQPAMKRRMGQGGR